jgi:hypothetical protein
MMPAGNGNSNDGQRATGNPCMDRKNLAAGRSCLTIPPRGPGILEDIWFEELKFNAVVLSFYLIKNF